MISTGSQDSSSNSVHDPDGAWENAAVLKAVPVTAQPAGRGGLGREGMRELSMTKTWHLIQETVQNAKHPFRQVENRSAKAKKNRYERRKIRELLRLGDWAGELEA